MSLQASHVSVLLGYGVEWMDCAVYTRCIRADAAFLLAAMTRFDV